MKRGHSGTARMSLNGHSEPRARLLSGPALVAYLGMVTLVLHFLTNGQYGYHGDELYFMACGEHLDFGYVDHAPLIAVVAKVSRLLLGDSLFAIRFFPALAGAATVILTGMVVRTLGGLRFAQCLAALGILIAPVYLRAGNMLGIPAFEPLFWTLASYLVIIVVKHDRPKLWLVVGAVAGLGLLNKHSMLLWGFGLVIGLLITPARKHLFNKWLWVGGLVAFLIFLPNLIWQIQHDWLTLKFIRNLNEHVMGRISPLEFGFGQIFYIHPANAPIWLLGLVYLLRAARAWMLLVLLLCATGRRSVFMTAIRSRRTSGVLVVTGALLFGSWFGFVWAVANNHVLQISLAYFISPLVKMLLGVVFLRERLRRRQIASVLLATLGVAYLTVQQGQLPLLALGLSLVMNLYIMLRKIASVDGLVGLGSEMTFLLTPALAYTLWLWMHGDLVFGAAPAGLNSLLALSGVITTLPLLWVVSAARRLRLVTLGFIQYIMPSIHFLLAVVAYEEPCTQTHLVSFGCIWTALVVYSLDSTRAVLRR